jgi:hypothetical protein
MAFVELDDFMGQRYEAAFREHLVRLAARGELGDEIVDIGRARTRHACR